MNFNILVLKNTSFEYSKSKYTSLYLKTRLDDFGRLDHAKILM